MECLTEGCYKEAVVRDLCRTHYNQMRELGQYGGRKRCVERDCNKFAVARNLCSRHYQARYRAGSLEFEVCAEEGCLYEVEHGKTYCLIHVPFEACAEEECWSRVKARGLCATHYQAYRRETIRRRREND